MIVEIALGIILAVIILALLPAILELGIVVSGFLLVVSAGGLLIYWAVYHTSDLAIFFSFIGVFSVGSALAHYISKKTGLTVGELGVLAFFALLTAVFGGVAVAAYQDSGEFTKVLWLLPFFVLWAIVTVILRERVKKRPDGAPTPETHVHCPDCRKLILKEAHVCKHCGCRLVPQL